MATTFTLNFGGKRKLQASPLTLVYYNEEFSKNNDADMLGDYISLTQFTSDLSKLSAIKLMRIVWACEKTYKNGVMESFEHWTKMLDGVDYLNPELLESLSQAFESEYFRSANGAAKQFEVETQI